MSISGSVGCGKSTLLRWIYDTLDPERFEVLMVVLFKSEINAGWLTPRVAGMLGANNLVESNSQQKDVNYTHLLAGIGQRLDEIRVEGRRLVILIDACERLQTTAALDEISALTDAHLSGSAAVSILLVGSDEFQSEILGGKNSGSPLSTRVGFRDRLPVMSQTDVPAYIGSRLTEAGLPADTFSAEAADIAAKLSVGNLHLLNSLCENALVDSATAGLRQVSLESVQSAAKFILHSHLQRSNTPISDATTKPHSPSGKAKVKVESEKKRTHQNEEKNPGANVPLQSLFKPKSSDARKKGK